VAKEGQKAIELDGLARAVRQAGAVRPPVHLWNPPFCGDIDMRIAGDGVWYYQNTPIGRPALVKLFASLLRRENDHYFLITPVEKVGITVDDAPFVAVELAAEQLSGATVLRFRTNVDEWAACDAAHGLSFVAQPTGGLKPYLDVRDGLCAKLSRPVFYELVALGEEREVNGVLMFGIASAGVFFPMAPADTLRI
jgi:hypothetical protein